MNRKKRVRWTPVMEATLIDMWNRGKTTGQVALKLGVTPGQVSGQIAFIRKRGVYVQIREPTRYGVPASWTHRQIAVSASQSAQT